MANLFFTVGRTDVNEAAVQSFIRDGGAVANLLNDVAQDTFQHGRRVALRHARSKRLWGGIFWNRTKTTGPYTGSALAGSSAKHTRYFHDGTAGNGAGYISHPKMIVPINKRKAHTNPAFKGAGSQTMAENASSKWKGTKRKDKVKGQIRKPFLTEGLAVSLAKRGLV